MEIVMGIAAALLSLAGLWFGLRMVYLIGVERGRRETERRTRVILTMYEKPVVDMSVEALLLVQAMYGSTSYGVMGIEVKQ